MSRNLPRSTNARNLCDWLSKTWQQHYAQIILPNFKSQKTLFYQVINYLKNYRQLFRWLLMLRATIKPHFKSRQLLREKRAWLVIRRQFSGKNLLKYKILTLICVSIVLNRSITWNSAFGSDSSCGNLDRQFSAAMSHASLKTLIL